MHVGITVACAVLTMLHASVLQGVTVRSTAAVILVHAL
jgi:hypothetical protein